MIRILNKQRRVLLPTESIKEMVHKVLSSLGYEDFDIGILFTTNKNMQEYNRQYRNKDKATDILSFAYHQLKPGETIQITTEEDKNLGDLILAPSYIQQAVQELNIPFEERLKVLLVHGICHLLGYDHEKDEDWQLMQAKEDELIKAINR